MFAISVFFEIDPAHSAEFAKLSLRHAENTLKNEDGCLDFRILQSPDNPDSFYFHEAYKDRAAVEDVHMKTEYLAAFFVATEPWIVKKEMKFWNGAKA